MMFWLTKTIKSFLNTESHSDETGKPAASRCWIHISFALRLCSREVFDPQGQGRVIVPRQNSMAPSGSGVILRFLFLLSIGIGVVNFFVLASALHASSQGNPQPAITQLQTEQLERSRNEIIKNLNPRSVRDHILLGEIDFRLGDFAGAIRALQEALLLDPNSEPAHYTLSLCYLRLNRVREAIEQLQKVVKLDPGNESANYNLGSLLELQGRYKEALRYFEACESGHNDPEALVHLINVYFKIADEQRGLQPAKEAIEHDSRGSVTAQVGLLLLENNQYAEAATAFEKSLPLDPNSLDLTIDLAEAYLGANEAERAIGLLNRFEERQPSWQVNALLGQAYELAAKPQEAIRCLREALHSKPDEPAIHYELGKLLVDSANTATQEGGIEEIRQAIDLDPHETKYYIGLATYLLNHRDLKAAAALLTQGASKTKPSDKLYLMLGLAQLWLYGSHRAVPILQKVIDLNPHSGPAYNLLSGCYFGSGDYRKALVFYEKATKESPQDGFYFYNIARTFERLNELTKAVPFAQRSVQLNPESSTYHFLLGKIYSKLGRNTEAVNELKTSVHLNPQSLPPYYLLARTYMRINDPVQASLWSHKFSNLRSEKDSLRNRKLSAPASEPLSFPDSSEALKSLGYDSFTAPPRKPSERSK